ncbi:FAD-linked oxidoreductase [Cutaneotrichosporon oleaginosum]|uniref:Proline dehydrogenase n=1 Tax=Cutaneotrichosporon oleaginosum TaxID=879819 RepID=A0A0J0XRC1_9TREE|nr:FAD-linked oxidoreductase [Cutaneotrichosporon oleaginosum]KLT43686.1 FAD-linked oxidoreductase [Cutaneotrichosporon oleaginosum]TXT05105.1 hypothetical protein COLE_06425 [Cutaneotrichosporon oleaginosum]
MWGGAAAFVVLGTVWFLSGDDGSDDPILGRPNPADVAYLSRLPTSKLISGWIVYAFCSSPLLIDISGGLFKILRSIPLVSSLTDDFARRTFFRQFFGYETAAEAAVGVWAPLRKEHIGVLTALNIEAETYECLNTPEVIREGVEGTLDCIEHVGKFGVANSTKDEVANGDTRCWVRTKVSGLVPDPQTMMRASEQITRMRAGTVHYPGIPEDGDFERLMNLRSLSASDMEALKNVYTYLQQYMHAGQKHGVRIIIDAEQSWYQPAVDVMTEQLMREFNTGKDGKSPVVVASFQAYLRRNPELVRSQIERAKEGGYKLIYKQVRGAYMPYERERWAKLKMPGPPPVWGSKAETDASYRQSIETGINAIAAHKEDPSTADVAVIFATHNEISVDDAIGLLAKTGLGTQDESGRLIIDEYTANRVAFAQIYGMKDSLTNRIAANVVTPSGLPLVCKSAPYGTLEHALPNLARRAAENKSVMEGRGGAIAERKRLGRELCRRYVPFYSSDR